MRWPNWNKKYCHLIIWALVSLNDVDMKLFTQLIFNARCRSGSASGAPSETTGRQTQRKCTDSQRIRTDIPTCLSSFEERKRRFKATLAERGKLLKLILMIFISRESGRSDAWQMTAWVWSQNCLVIPRSRTCNSAKVTISYNLWGGDPRPSKQAKAGGNSCALWLIKKSLAGDSNGASRRRNETRRARSTWWRNVIETERRGCVTGDNSPAVFLWQTCLHCKLECLQDDEVHPCDCQS